MFKKKDICNYKPLANAITMRPLVCEDKTLHSEFKPQKGEKISMHNLIRTAAIMGSAPKQRIGLFGMATLK